MESEVTILIIDDKPGNIFALENLLEKEGRTLIGASSGSEGLKIALNKDVDLIILDAQMPEMDGFEVAQLLKSNRKTKDIPIIFASAEKKEREFVMKGYEGGALDYLSKPLDPELTKAKVSILLQIQLQRKELIRKNLSLEEAEKRVNLANEELKSTNDKLKETNEELVALNDQLVKAAQVIQEQSETIIRQKDEQLNRVLDSSNDVIWSLDLTGGGKNYISRSAETIYGESLEVLAKRQNFGSSRIYPRDIQVRESCWQHLEKQGISECIYRVILPSGIRWMHERLKLIRDDKGKKLRIEGIATDITSIKESEIRLEEYRENLEIIFKNSSDHFQLMDASGRLILFNQNYENLVSEVLGIKPKIGMLFWEVIPLGYREEYRKLFERTLHGETFYYQSKINTAAGEKFFELRYSPVINQGVTTHVSISSTDITERKKIEESQRAAEEQLKLDQFFLEKASEAASIGYWTSEPDAVNGKLTWSKEVFKIFQLDEKDFDGRNQTFFDFIHPEDRERVMESSRIAMEQGHVYNVDHRIVLKNGRIRWVNERATLISNENEPVLMVGIIQDINDRKLTEQVLREYNDRHEILSKATKDAIWDWNIPSDIEIWNHGIETIFGYVPTQIQSIHGWWKEKIHPDDVNRVMSETQSAFDKKSVNITSEYRFRCSDDSYKNVLDRAYIIYREGKPVRMIGAMQDVTEVAQYRENLEKMVEERTNKLNIALLKEKELVDMKSKFISIASHEFRTPLTTISLASGFMKRYKGKLKIEQIEEKTDTIDKQIRHMTSLVDDVLFVGKVEDGKVKVTRKELGLDIIEKLAQEALNSCKDSHVLEFSFEGENVKFKSDEKLLRNIVFNLITNAAKFSPQSPRIFLKVINNSVQVKICVRDEGIGIPSDELNNLFVSFTRASNAAAIEGTGLGLLIIKKATELLNGTIHVESELGKGTEFTVTLPLGTLS